MTNFERYNAAFTKVFNVEGTELESLEYKQTPEWNSMAQIALVAQLEDAFDLDLDMDDIYDLTSYKTGLELLNKKFEIEF